MELEQKEISIKVDPAAQDATKEMKKVLASVNDISNINISAFLTAVGNQVKIKSENLKTDLTGLHSSDSLPPPSILCVSYNA